MRNKAVFKVFIMNHLTKEEATKFFESFYRGEHHFPSELKEFGYGWCINHRGTVATFDFDELTRLIVMAHDCCIRVEISPCNPQLMKIAIWKRQREGSLDQRHPRMEEAIAITRERLSKSNYPIAELVSSFPVLLRQELASQRLHKRVG